MTWIKTSEKLPKQGEYCWLYGFYEPGEEFIVFEGFFDEKSHCIIDNRLSIEPGWEHNTERSDYVPVRYVSHWMPYFTPEPPTTRCNYCLNPESIITHETCCTGCDALK